MAQQPASGLGRLTVEVSRSHTHTVSLSLSLSLSLSRTHSLTSGRTTVNEYQLVAEAASYTQTAMPRAGLEPPIPLVI